MPPCLNTLAYLDATIANFLSHFSTPNSISRTPPLEKKATKNTWSQSTNFLSPLEL